jgi:uncharacterized protein YhaN
MKIRRLLLKAYGPFSDRELDFASSLPGLHIVHGPNEAGKSSALRALQALLFGFPPRTGDNFLHAYDQLLVGGCLLRADGRELCFFRRKKNKNDLFDAKDQPLSADTLVPFLQGVGKDIFSSQFGIDHETLVRGGQGILQQEGEIGQALFAAGAGFASLKSVIDGLEADADVLFRPRATSREITVAVAQYKELQSRLRQVSLGGQDWLRHRQALAHAEKQLRDLEARSSGLDREIHLLERVRRALPSLGRRHLLREKLQAMGEVVALPDDFGAQRRLLDENRRVAKVRLDSAEGRLAELENMQLAIRLNQTVLDHAEGIEDLHQRLGAYRKGQQDYSGLEGMRVAYKTEAAQLLRRIRPELDVEQAESLRPGLAKRKTVQALGQRYEAVVQEVRQAGARVRELERELAARKSELSAQGKPADGSSLVQALNLVLKSGDLDEDLRVRGVDLSRARGNCQAALQRLGLWKGALEEVKLLCLPLPETVSEFETALQAVDEEHRRLCGEEEKTGQALADLRRDLRAIEQAAVVPTEAELAESRGRRQEGWSLLRRHWIEGEDVQRASQLYSPELPLPEAYEQSVELADQTADRMYREADRVQKHAQILSGMEAAESALLDLRGRIQALLCSRDDLLARWKGHWVDCGISPLGPREMRAWSGNFEALRLQVEELGRMKADLVTKQARRRELREILLRELAVLGEEPTLSGDGLEEVVRRAQAVTEKLREANARRESLARSLTELQAALDKAETTLQNARLGQDEWRQAWEEALGFLGLPGSASPVEAAEYVETVQECLAKLHEEDVLRKRIKGIERDGRAFESSVRELAALIAPEETKLDAALAVGQLKGLLAQAVRDQAVFLRHGEEKALLTREILGLREELCQFEEGMAALRQLSRCADDESMTLAERRFTEYAGLRRELNEVELHLIGMAEGGTLEDLEDLAAGQDADALPGRIAALRADLEEHVKPQMGPLAERVGQEKNELARMNGDDAAARIADEMQEVLARISRMTDRYIRLKLASRVLRAEIESYRAANQDPLLAIASDLFRELTLGSFAGLRADIDENDSPVLIGVRSNGLLVRVEGMSSGTRDQLYLALRLASLQLRSQSTEAMPFIVDDILINFDEERANATLGVFAGMADRNQIIMFTHQAQIADMARSLGREDRVFVHSL